MFPVDAALTSEARELLGRKHPVFAVARVTGEGTSVGAVGASLEADFEIGSISKGVTGLLYVDALNRGEVTPGTTLGEILPLAGSAAAAVTLSALSTHTSGLPRLAKTSDRWRRGVALMRHGTNPYGDTLEILVGQARTVPVGRPGPRYSNLGYMLLGHALAAAAGTSRSGRGQEPWTGEALGPAGGIRASIGAMARLTEALLDGTAPGVAALDPVEGFSGGLRIGAAWMTLSGKGRQVTFHNGGTGGFRSWMGVDRAAAAGVVVLSATSRPVDRCGFRLLTQVAAPN